MNGKQIILYDFEDLPHGTKATIVLNKTDLMRVVSFGENFGTKTGEVITSSEISRKKWEVILGWD
ncbi:hypothetical protein [Bacteroides sp.]|uniref:hypothetical protein n=1 Tax=Bacteroides sp. TaxID=29523 RepID=UPI0031FD2999